MSESINHQIIEETGVRQKNCFKISLQSAYKLNGNNFKDALNGGYITRRGHFVKKTIPSFSCGGNEGLSSKRWLARLASQVSYTTVLVSSIYNVVHVRVTFFVFVIYV